MKGREFNKDFLRGTTEGGSSTTYIRRVRGLVTEERKGTGHGDNHQCRRDGDLGPFLTSSPTTVCFE